MHLLDYSQTDNRVIGNVLERQGTENADTPFLITEESSLTFAETYAAVRQYAAAFADRGIGKDDHVCFFLDACTEYVIGAFACTLLGARWIPVNTDYRGAWLQETITESQPKILVADEKHLGHLKDIDLAGIELIVRENLAESFKDADAKNFERHRADFGDTVAVLWTSGTTGKSKGVMQSHNTWVRAAVSSIEMGQYREGDVTYSCLPLYNSAAWVTCIFPALLSGTTVAIDPAFSASDFWNRIRRFDATHTFTLGAMHMFLWNAPEQEDDADQRLRSANMVPMPDAVHRPFCQRFGLEGIHQGFGQSEVMYLTRRIDDGNTEWPSGSLGIPADDLELALLDDDRQPVAVGETGEICVRPLAPNVLFNGYYNFPEANAAAFQDGWYHTGDLARQDKDGHYYFVDRKKDVLRYKGRNVSSVAIESIARGHPAIANVAVFGIESDELEHEHEIMLAAVLNPGSEVTEEEMARYINDNAPYFFVPRYIEFVEALPMTPTQKVRKIELRDRGLTHATWDARQAGFEVRR